MIAKGEQMGDRVTFLADNALGEKCISHYSNPHLSIIASGEIYNAQYTNVAQYLAKAYKQWGKQLPAQLYGNGWWFIIHDNLTGETFAATEQYGNPTLYYTVYENHLVLALNLADVRKAVPVGLDFTYLVNEMVSTPLNKIGFTHFKEVFYLPMGHMLSYSNGGLKIEKYWFPEDIVVRKGENKESLYEELHTLYHDAVAKCLKGATNPAALLSGGLDSGSLVTLAAEILAGQNLPLHTVSHVPKYPGIPSAKSWVGDESPHIRQIISKHKNINSVLMKSENTCPIDSMYQFIQVNECFVAGAGNIFWLMDSHRHLQELGADVCLSGKHGNYALSAMGLPHLLPLYHPYYTQRPRRLISRLLKPFKKPQQEQILANTYLSDDVITSAFQQRVLLETQTESIFSSQLDNLVASLNLANYNHLFKLNGFNNQFGFEIKDPTADLRVIEFCLSLPNEMYFGPQGQGRYLMRKIMHNSMPHSVLYDTTRGRQASDIGLRLIDSREKINTTLETLATDTDYCALMNLQKLQETANSISEGTDIGYMEGMGFCKAIMPGLFMQYLKKG